MSQRQLAQSAFAGQAQLLGRQGEGSRGDRRPGSGRAGPLGLPLVRVLRAQTDGAGEAYTAICRPLPVCRGLRSREQGQICPHDLMGQALAQSPCSPCGLHPGSSTRVAPAAHTPAPHTLTDASCIFCVQHTHQHGGPRAQHAPLPGLNICPQCALSHPALLPYTEGLVCRRPGRGTHGGFLSPSSSPKHCCHCRVCWQLFPHLVSDSHAVQAPAAPRGGVRGSPASQVISPCDRSLPWGRAYCPSAGLLRAEAVSPPQTDCPPCPEPALGPAQS